jgi:hypothetical protein
MDMDLVDQVTTPTCYVLIESELDSWGDIDGVITY